jgi:DHA2 family multidrug resistance protein
MITNTAAPYIAGSLGASNDISTYTTTFFSLGCAIMLPLTRLISCRIGSIPLLNICLIFFAITSQLCVYTHSYLEIVVVRLFQGLSSGPIFPIAAQILLNQSPKKWKEPLLTAIIILSVIGPVIGSSWGGVIAYMIDWRWMFEINTPLILALVGIFHVKLRRSLPPAPHVDFNAIGFISYILGIIGLVSSITLGQFLDWQRSPLWVGMTIVGGVCFIFYLLWDSKHPHPIVHLQLFKNKTFSLAMVMMAVVFSAYFGMVLLLGLWLAIDVKYSVVWIAIIMGHMAVAALFLAIFSKPLNKIDPRYLLIVSLFFFTISCFYTDRFSVDIDFFRIALSRILAGLGLAFFIGPMFRITLFAVREEQTGDAMAIFQILRNLSSGLGASVYATVWWRRSIFFRDRLSSQLTAYSEVTENFFLQAKEQGLSTLQSKALLNDMLNKQSTALALDDTFFLMGVLLSMMLALMLCIVLRDHKKKLPST